MYRALDADIENNREFAKEMGKRHDLNVKATEDFFANMTQVTDVADCDIRTLDRSSKRHRSELDGHTKAIKALTTQVEGLVRVVNGHTHRIKDLQEAVDANDNIIATQQEWIAKMRGQRECNCGQVDPLLATVSRGVKGSDEDEELEYEEEEVPGTTLLDAGINLALTTRLVPVEPVVSVPIPGRFPTSVSPLRVIEDSECVVPPVSKESCGCVDKENADPVQVPAPVPTPVVLREQAVRRSPRSLKLGRPASPYPLRPIAFAGSRTSGRPIAYYSRGMYIREHSTGKIRPGGRVTNVGRSDDGSTGGTSSDGGSEYGPDSGDYDRELCPESARYCPGLESSPGRHVDGDRHC